MSEEDTMNINGKWYTETELQAYVKELEARVSELEDKHHNECGQIAHYSDELNEVNSYAEMIENIASVIAKSNTNKREENAKMKELLRKAVEDFHDVLTSQRKITFLTVCEKCKQYLECNCKDECVTRHDLKQWRYADEALALIGGAENDTRRNP